MTTTAERIAELTAAWEDAVNYGAAPEDRSRASDYTLSEDDWKVGLNDDEAAEIVALIQQRETDREKAERIAGKVAVAGWDRDTENGTGGPERAMRYRLRSDAARAAALAALTEKDAAR